MDRTTIIVLAVLGIAVGGTVFCLLWLAMS